MMWIALLPALAAVCYLAYGWRASEWRTSVAVEQNVRLQRRVALLEHDLSRAEDVDRLWYRAKESDPRAERALIARWQQELDGWGSDDERSGSR